MQKIQQQKTTNIKETLDGSMVNDGNISIEVDSNDNIEELESILLLLKKELKDEGTLYPMDLILIFIIFTSLFISTGEFFRSKNIFIPIICLLISSIIGVFRYRDMSKKNKDAKLKNSTLKEELKEKVKMESDELLELLLNATDIQEWSREIIKEEIYKRKIHNFKKVNDVNFIKEDMKLSIKN